MSTLTFVDLPTHVLAAILGGFGSGQMLSTVLLTVARGNAKMRASALPLLRGILVQRYVELAVQLRDAGELEIKDVVDVVREDIRRSSSSDDDDESIVTKFSHWCAILDYFERQWNVRSKHQKLQVPTKWIVWSGTVEIPYGPTSVCLMTSQWTAGALAYWRNRELSALTLTHPRNSHLETIRLPLYGSVVGVTENARHRLQLQNRDLSFHNNNDNNPHDDDGLDWVLARQALVPMDELYSSLPSVAFVATAAQTISTNAEEEESAGRIVPEMKCYWDAEDGEEGDWEDAVASLGEHAIRVMNNCTVLRHSNREDIQIQSLESCLEDFYTSFESRSR